MAEAEIELELDSVIEYIENSDDEADFIAIRGALDGKKYTHIEGKSLSDDAQKLIEVFPNNLIADEKLCYFLKNIDNISFEQLKEIVDGQQV